MRIKVVRSADAVSELPEIMPLGNVGLESISLFVGAVGFEDRATACLAEFRERGSSVDTALLWQYSTNIPDNESNYHQIAEDLAALGARVIYASLYEDLRSYVGSILANVDDATVVVDISVMSGRLVLAAIGAMVSDSLATKIRLVAVYAEAAEYLPSRDEYEKAKEETDSLGTFGHDEGVLSVDATANVRASHDPQLRDEIVVVPGFSRDRVRAAISYINPTYLVAPADQLQWAISSPHLPADRWREQAMRDIHSVEDSMRSFTVSTFDYEALYWNLEEIYQTKWLESNMTIIFLGSKLQGLSVALFCAIRRGVRVIVSAPEQYRKEGYTRGVKALWAIDFQDWSRSLSALTRVGALEIVD